MKRAPFFIPAIHENRMLRILPGYMLTLNQIHQKLEAWFTSHAQINTVTVEDDFDFNAERSLVYPVANIEHKDSNTNNKSWNWRFNITIADLVNENIPGHDREIHSDAFLIAEDFFSFLQNEEGWTFSKSVNIEHFTDDTADRTAGITFTITLSTIRAQNTCQKPTR